MTATIGSLNTAVAGLQAAIPATGSVAPAPITAAAAPATSTPAPTTTPAVSATGVAAPTDAKLAAALQQLITVLSALVDAIKGAHSSAGGPGQLPTQSPTQSPVQAPMKVAAGGPISPTPVTSGGGPTALVPSTALQPVSTSYSGPSVGVETGSTGSPSYVFRGTNATSTLQAFGRYGSANVGLGQNKVHLFGPETRTDVAIPDSGSVTLSTGASFAWTGVTRPDGALQYNELSFAVTRPGAAATSIDRSLDTTAGYERFTSPLSDAETAELVKLLASTYPAATR